MGAITFINIGSSSNDGTGFSLRQSFQTINENYANLVLLANVISTINPNSAAILANISVPAVPTSIVGRDSSGSAYFNNITANVAVINGGAVFGSAHLITANTNPIIDLSLSEVHVLTLTSNVSSSTFINPSHGREYTFKIKQGPIGGFSWVWPSNSEYGGNIGLAYNNTTANSYSIQKFMSFDNSNTYSAVTPLVSFGV